MNICYIVKVKCAGSPLQPPILRNESPNFTCPGWLTADCLLQVFVLFHANYTSWLVLCSSWQSSIFQNAATSDVLSNVWNSVLVETNLRWQVMKTAAHSDVMSLSQERPILPFEIFPINFDLRKPPPKTQCLNSSKLAWHEAWLGKCDTLFMPIQNDNSTQLPLCVHQQYASITTILLFWTPY